MQCPEKVAGHDVGDDGEQHHENREPENPTVVHSTPTRRTIAAMLVIMGLVVHRKQTTHISDTGVPEKEKGQNRIDDSKLSMASLRPDRRFRDSTAN